MPKYNLIEYSNNYSKTSGSQSQYIKDRPALDDDGNIMMSVFLVMTHRLNLK